MGLIAWVKKLRAVVRDYDADVRDLRVRIGDLHLRASQAEQDVKRAEKLIRDRTEVDVDVGVRGDCTVIVTGRYKDADYINVFNVRPGDMYGLVQQLREMERFANIRRIDAPVEFRSTIRRGLLKP